VGADPREDSPDGLVSSSEFLLDSEFPDAVEKVSRISPRFL
jgi:hypothetical protein